jgi:hypothetical protein
VSSTIKRTGEAELIIRAYTDCCLLMDGILAFTDGWSLFYRMLPALHGKDTEMINVPALNGLCSSLGFGKVMTSVAQTLLGYLSQTFICSMSSLASYSSQPLRH